MMSDQLLPAITNYCHLNTQILSETSYHTPSGGGANLSDVSCHRSICKIVRIFGPVHILQDPGEGV